MRRSTLGMFTKYNLKVLEGNNHNEKAIFVIHLLINKQFYFIRNLVASESILFFTSICFCFMDSQTLRCGQKISCIQTRNVL